MTISSTFDLSANRLSGDDVDIRPLWAHIVEKTKTKAMMANPMTDTAEDRMAMQDYIFKQAGIIAEPMAVFGDCVPRRSRDALMRQLELQRESVQKALEQGNLGFLKFKLDQLRQLNRQTTLPTLTECSDALFDCAQAVVSFVDNKYSQLKNLLKRATPQDTISMDDEAICTSLCAVVCLFDSQRAYCNATHGVKSIHRSESLAGEAWALVHRFTTVLVDNISKTATAAEYVEDHVVTAKASLVLLTKLSDNLNENRHVVGIECTIMKETAASSTKTLLSVNPRLHSVFQACLRSSDLCGALSDIHKV